MASSNQQQQLKYKKLDIKVRDGLFVGPTGTRNIAFDPSFGSFTLLEPVSH